MSGKIMIVDPNTHRRNALCQAIQKRLYPCIPTEDIVAANISNTELT